MKRWGLVGLLLAAGCLGNHGDVVEVTGQIEATVVRAGSRVGGRVAEVLASEGDRVAAGDVLVRLEDAEAQALVAAAEAQLAQARALLAKVEAGARSEQIRQAEAAAAAAEARFRMAEEGFRSQEVAAARAGADAARARRDEARTEFGRLERLLASEAVSRQLYDRAKLAYDATAAQYDGARQKLDLLTEGLRAGEIAVARANRDQAAALADEARNGARPEDIAAAQAARDAAVADLMRARVALDEMTVAAPCDGVVESLDVHPGDLVKPGAIVSLVDPEDLELVVFVGAALLGHLDIGQEVTLTTDSHGDATFRGAIAHVASAGEFTPRNLQTQEERVQQVFGVKIVLDSAQGRLRAGMTATAHLPRQREGR